MKDLNDVVSYLNNVLGPHHDLTIAAREAAESPTNPMDEINIDPDAVNVMTWALSGMIYMIRPVGHIIWTDAMLPEQLKNVIFNEFSLEEIVEELDMSDKYPDESDDLMDLGMHIEMTCNDRPEEVLKLVKIIENDCAGDVLANISS